MTPVDDVTRSARRSRRMAAVRWIGRYVLNVVVLFGFYMAGQLLIGSEQTSREKFWSAFCFAIVMPLVLFWLDYMRQKRAKRKAEQDA